LRVSSIVKQEVVNDEVQNELLTIKSYRLLTKKSFVGAFNSPLEPAKNRTIKARSVCVIRDAAQSRDWMLKVRECIGKELSFFINSSNGLTVILPSITISYKYFLGPGNNSSLVNKFFTSRPWWVRVDESQLNEANLVWTQGKLSDFFNLMSNCNPSPSIINHSMQGKSITCQDLLEDISIPLKSLDMSTLGYDLITKSDSFLALEENLTLNPFSSKIQNKLEFNFNLSDKKFLYRNMKQFYFEQGEDVFEYLPLTFHIDNQSSELSSFLATAQKMPHQIWILKPGENSNRGSGIIVTNKINRIVTEINPVITGEVSTTFIIQKYIEKPFLINKRKFDIRLYTLCTFNNGVFQAYFYQEGYLRTACRPFNVNDMDKFIHLTNDAVQNKCEDYGKWENGNKLSYSDFQRYLDSKKIKVKFDESVLPKIKKIVRDTVQATWKKINKNLRLLNFEIFGYDFLLDSNLKPWLLEVNTNPCLELSATNLARIIPAMLENAFKIAVDPLFPEFASVNRRIGYRGSDFLSENKFELIFRQDWDFRN
jgi:hypothetical protein